jgi:hypothetical protein
MGYKVSSLIQDPHPYGVPTHGTRPNDPGPSIVLHPLFRGDFIEIPNQAELSLSWPDTLRATVKLRSSTQDKIGVTAFTEQ